MKTKSLISICGHLGTYRYNWQPTSERFATGYRRNILIYNIAQTTLHFSRALNFIQRIVFKFGKIYLYGLSGERDQSFVAKFKRLRQIVTTAGWKGGFVTNARTFRKKIVNVTKKFSAVIGVNYDYQNYSLPAEAIIIKIPALGAIDSNANAGILSYPIPINSISYGTAKCLAFNIGLKVFQGISKRVVARFRRVRIAKLKIKVLRLRKSKFKNKILRKIASDFSPRKIVAKIFRAKNRLISILNAARWLKRRERRRKKRQKKRSHKLRKFRRRKLRKSHKLFSRKIKQKLSKLRITRIRKFYKKKMRRRFRFRGKRFLKYMRRRNYRRIFKTKRARSGKFFRIKEKFSRALLVTKSLRNIRVISRFKKKRKFAKLSRTFSTRAKNQLRIYRVVKCYTFLRKRKAFQRAEKLKINKRRRKWAYLNKKYKGNIPYRYQWWKPNKKKSKNYYKAYTKGVKPYSNRPITNTEIYFINKNKNLEENKNINKNKDKNRYGRRWNRTTAASFSGLYSTIELPPRIFLIFNN